MVTNLRFGTAEWLYDTLYCPRGHRARGPIPLEASDGGAAACREPDQAAQEPACLRSHQLPLANQVRPVVNTPAYWLMLTVRDAISQPQALASAEFTTFPKLACRDRDKGPHRRCRRLSRGGVVSRRCAQPAGRWNRYYRGMVP